MLRAGGASTSSDANGTSQGQRRPALIAADELLPALQFVLVWPKPQPPPPDPNLNPNPKLSLPLP